MSVETGSFFMENESQKLRVGIIGLGKMGLLHASLLSVNPSVELAALCDKSSIMRKFAKNTLKTPLITGSLEKMAGLDIDAIYITTPIPSHYSIIKDVYGPIARNVFVEKTLSSSYAQSQELCAIASTKKGCNMVGYMKRFSVTFRKAKELMENGAIGSLLSFDAYAYSSDFYGIDNDKVSGARGGVLEDLGSHVVDLSLWYFGDSLSSAETFSTNHAKPGIVEFGVEGLHGFLGKFSVSWVQKDYRMPEFGLTVRGTEGAIHVTDNVVRLSITNEEPVALYRQDLDDFVGFYLGDSEYYRENIHFLESVRNNAKPEPCFETAKRVDYLLDLVRKTQ